MPFANVKDARLHYRIVGQGEPLLLLHAGWGLAVNHFAYQEQTLAGQFRMIIPDRRGYGQSTPVDVLEPDFHWQGAQDMLGLLDVLQVERPCVWGHSDGAVIGALMAITAPDRVRALVFEGGHLYNRKPLSQTAFETLFADPTRLPESTQRKMIDYYGPDDWQAVIRHWAGAWLDLARREGDLYRGRLGEIACPALVILGGQDEHTPASEMEALVARIPRARLSIYPEAGHGVHDSRAAREACTQEVIEFLREAGLPPAID